MASRPGSDGFSQAALPYDEPPAWYLPVANRYGEALMLEGRTWEADEVYKQSLSLSAAKCALEMACERVKLAVSERSRGVSVRSEWSLRPSTQERLGHLRTLAVSWQVYILWDASRNRMAIGFSL